MFIFSLDVYTYRPYSFQSINILMHSACPMILYFTEECVFKLAVSTIFLLYERIDVSVFSVSINYISFILISHSTEVYLSAKACLKAKCTYM